MQKRAKLNKLDILVADGDPFMAETLTATLKGMGFERVSQAQSGEAAEAHLAKNPTDLLITEWAMQPVDGLELVGRLRKKPSAHQTMPIIMLTARSEKKDVEQARDAGITEFLSKPYTAETLFTRLQHVVDAPRSFILSKDYVGPDRRTHTQEWKDDRRRLSPQIITSDALAFADDYTNPLMRLAEFTLKNKMGLSGALETAITPDILHKAQQDLDGGRERARPWIRKDLDTLDENYAELCKQPSTPAVEALKHATLSIKARAGTFNDMMTSNAAQITYLFLRNQYAMNNKFHNTVLLKHLQVLNAVFMNNSGASSALAHELIRALHMLAKLAM